MGVRFYDQAIVNKINKWIVDPNLRVLKPEETQRLFEVLADEGNDKPLKLPLIAISRDPNISINTAKKPLTFNGLSIGQNPDKTIELNAIPIGLTYQIDIYTKRYDQGDEYFRNFVFNFINHPKMIVELPYNGTNVEHICYARLQPTAQDNSDIPLKLFADQFTRWTLIIRVDDAYLFSIPVTNNAKLEGVKLEVTNTNDINDIESEEIIA